MVRTFRIEEASFPDLPPMMLATLHALKTIGASASIQELDEKVIEIEGVTESEQQIPIASDHRPKLNYALAWCRTYLRRGGAVENSERGIWSLTEIGEKITSLAECKVIYDKVNAEERERSRKRRLEKKQAEQVSIEKETTTNLDIENLSISDEVSKDWRDDLLSAVRDMTPDGFERLSQRLLREAGFTKVEVRGKTGDGGIDGIGVLRVNLVSFQVYFQCKKWKGSVGAKDIRDFRGALQGRADKGLFITTGNFTSQASEEATRDGAIAIDLIDGDRLCELLKQYGLGVTTKMVEIVEVRSEWFQTV
jgi:restriction system protein